MALEKFTCGTVEGWLSWRATFMTIVTVRGWDAQRARRELFAAVQGLARTYIEDIPLEDELPAGAGPNAVIAPVAELLDLYEARFVPEAASHEAHVQWVAARQNEDETLQAWHSRCRHLHRRAYPMIPADEINGNPDLIRKFCLGIANPDVMEKTFESGPNNYPEALVIASRKEAVKKVTDGVRKGGKHHRSLFGMGSPSDARGGGNPGNRDCYLCHKDGHFFRDCHWYKRGQELMNRGGGRGGRGGNRGGSSRGSSRGRGRGGSSRGGSGKKGSDKKGKGRINSMEDKEEQEDIDRRVARIAESMADGPHEAEGDEGAEEEPDQGNWTGRE